MLGVRSAVRGNPKNRTAARRRRLSACAGSMPLPLIPQIVSHRNRKLETAFRSLATTFAHHCEVNVPGLFLRFHAANPARPARSRTPPLPTVSKPNQGRIPRPLPVVPRRSPALLRFHSISTPLWAFSALWIKAFDRAPLEEVCLTKHPIALLLPSASSLRISLRIVAQSSLCSARLIAQKRRQPRAAANSNHAQRALSCFHRLIVLRRLRQVTIYRNHRVQKSVLRNLRIQ